MQVNKKRLFITLLVLVLLVCAMTTMAFAESGEGQVSSMYGTFMALVPPIIAIVLALITKEVHSSLFVGILVGALFHANFNIEKTWTTIINDGFIAQLSDTTNVGILLFLVMLGIMVVLN